MHLVKSNTCSEKLNFYAKISIDWFRLIYKALKTSKANVLCKNVDHNERV